MPNYRHGTYDFVIDSSFQPFTMQEMLVPLTAYKDAYEKAEETYADLADKSDKFKYLSETLPEGSKARQLYEGYANELNKQAEDLAVHGLNVNNRRALTNLKRRYQGEIGRLVTADEALQKELALRRTMGAKDSSLLYATDNLGIDAFLDGNNPNLYSVSGNDLYSRGAIAGKSASSRIYDAGDGGSTLGGYYRQWIERNGYSPASINAFRQNAAAIPELQQAADAILAEQGVIDNLGDNPQALLRARQSVLNGIVDGAVYQESVKPIRDESVMSAYQSAQNARAIESQTIAQERWDKEKEEYETQRRLMYTFKKDKDGNEILDKNGRPIVEGINPAYFKGNYKMNPNTGKWEKDTQEKPKKDPILALSSADLKNEEGFDVIVDNDRHHYNYIKGFNVLGGVAGEMPLNSILDDPEGKKRIKVLSSSDLNSLLNNRRVYDYVANQVRGLDSDTDWEIVEVVTDTPSGPLKQYIIATH